VVKRGDYFTELYMIFKGKVLLSCTVKDENEFFTLHPTNFFGDYQILLGLKASEQYKATTSTEFTYCHCIKRKNFLKLLNQHTEAYIVFMDRALARRSEFRRIKKLYEKFAQVHPDPVTDLKIVQDREKFIVNQYSDNSKEEDKPPFLIDPEFYFQRSLMHLKIDEEVIENISDSETVPQFGSEDEGKHEEY